MPGKNKIGHNNFLNETSYRKDIYKFLDLFRPEAKQAAYEFKVEQIAGGIDNQQSVGVNGSTLDIEADLDSEQILSVSAVRRGDALHKCSDMPYRSPGLPR